MEMDKLKPKQSAFITRVGGDGALRHHLLDMGLTPGTEITLQKIAPMGDPIQIEVRGYELTLRLDEAKKIGQRAIKLSVSYIRDFVEEFRRFPLGPRK